MGCGCGQPGQPGGKRVRIERARLAPSASGQKEKLYTVHLSEVGEAYDVTTRTFAEANAVASRYGTPAPGWKAKSESRPGRFVTEGVLEEPLLALAEGLNHDVVGCCGDRCPETTTTTVPRGILFEDVKRSEEGFSWEPRRTKRAPEGHVDLPKSLVKAYEQAPRSGLPVCLPFVKIARDPTRFRACLGQARRLGPMDDAGKVYKLVGEWLAAEDQEVFLVILCDTQLHVRGVTELARGARDRVQVPIPDALRIAIVEGATAFIVVHNHPSGAVMPSEADKELTRAIAHAGKQVNLELLDHVIVGADSHWSFYDHGLLKS